MKYFYQAMLTDRMSAAAALRVAQLKMLKQPQRQAPYYWAAFMLHGEWLASPE
jgi:CHAT domain-containing protein